MNTITINKDFELKLNFDIQISPNGRPFQQCGLSKNTKIPSIWIKVNNTKYEAWHWIYSYQFLDEKGGFIFFEIDYYDKFYKKWTSK